MRKCPKPTILTSSPRSKQRKMMSKTDSTTDDDWRLESPWAATALTRSFFVTVTPHLLPTNRSHPLPPPPLPPHPPAAPSPPPPTPPPPRPPPPPPPPPPPAGEAAAPDRR